ncbi:transcriptional elongation protein Spt4, putative [Paecilomyces variotii No. 5]|uniref:Transcription elongation factor SPT4 n=1 Tax=Byssochlamys spectabilis (strain No. 5 / NBRC 109023) TaxID=1356009 RepID=V5FQQ2_BYSSN|nr:transcriptional elongation protein Spt4, putative [Paecilomyces variotii No. 5]
MSFYVAPGQQRTLRACMVCSLVQLQGPSSTMIPKTLQRNADPAQKFVREGCPNCDHVLGLRGNSEAVQECTSQVFEGLISLSDVRTSWVARWQRLEGYVPGTYAVKVVGSLPSEVVASLEDSGVKYIPRDGSSLEEEA